MSPKADRGRRLAAGQNAPSACNLTSPFTSPPSSAASTPESTPPIPRPQASGGAASAPAGRSPREPYPKPLPQVPGAFPPLPSQPLPQKPEVDEPSSDPVPPSTHPALASIDSFLASAMDTTSHLKTSLSSTLTSAIDSTKQGIPSRMLMGWFGGPSGHPDSSANVPDHISPFEDDLLGDDRASRHQQSVMQPQSPDPFGSYQSEESRAADPLLIRFGESHHRPAPAPPQQQKKRQETIDDLLS